MSVIIRLQNLPWSANAMDIRNFFRGLSIPEGGVHIVGGEQGDAFIAFSTDEDARQAMMLDGGRIKEVQVKLLLSSRSEMHKVIEAARQTVPILQLQPMPPQPPAPPVIAPVVAPPAPAIPPSPFAPALGHLLQPANQSPNSASTIPGLGSPGELPPQPAVIEPPAPAIPSPSETSLSEERSKKKEKPDRRRSRSKSRDRDKKDSGRRDREKKDRRDRSRSRDRRRRSRSRDRRDRKRDRKDRSRSRDRTSRDKDDSRRSRDKRESSDKPSANKKEGLLGDNPYLNHASAAVGLGAGPGLGSGPALGGGLGSGSAHGVGNPTGAMQKLLLPNIPPPSMYLPNAQANMTAMNMMVRPFAAFGNATPMLAAMGVRPGAPSTNGDTSRFPLNSVSTTDALSRLQELGNKRNPNAFQGNNDHSGPVLPRRSNDQPFNKNMNRPPRPSRFDRSIVPGCCIIMKNVPTDIGYGDVRRFFGGHFIATQGIKMVNDQSGRRTGVVYVRFADTNGKHEAISRDGWQFRDQRVSIQHVDDEEYDNAIDSFLPVRNFNMNNDIVLQTNDDSKHSDRFERPFTVMRIAELPPYVKEHDIIKKFSEYSLLSINLMDDRKTKTRTAYVQFVKHEDAKLAYDRKYQFEQFGRKTAAVSLVSDEDYENAKQEYSGNVVEVIDDGDEGDEDDKAEEQEEDTSQAVEAPRDPRQRRAQQPLDDKNTTQPPNLFAHPVFPPPTGVFPGAPFPPPGGFQMAAPGPPAPAWNQQVISGSPDCVLVKGLSPRATDRTIIDFFGEAKVVPSRIHLMLDQTGKPSGDCFCEFRTANEASQAAVKHGSTIDGRTISVDLVDRKIVEEALEGPKQDIPNERPPFRSGPPAPFDFRGGFNPSRGGFFRGRGGFDRGRGGFERGGLRGRGGFDRGFDRGGYDRGGMRGRGFPRGGFRGGPRGGFNSHNNNGGGGGGDGDAASEDPPLEPEGFGQPGCVVSLENVPFRASVDEILEFFGDFELTQDDVIRRFNDRGMPTGDARVCFRTPFDAQRAIKTCNMQQIRGRNVALSIV